MASTLPNYFDGFQIIPPPVYQWFEQESAGSEAAFGKYRYQDLEKLQFAESSSRLFLGEIVSSLEASEREGELGASYARYN